MSVPGVGPITALTYTSTIEDPRRFARSDDVGAYAGLVRPPTPLALPVAVIVIAGTTYGATVIDPLAFTPGAHADAGERGGGPEKGERGDD